MNGNEIALTEAQRRAVEWSGGTLLILAGPGAGKTEILTARAIRVIRATPKRWFKVLGLTSTNLAAGEMKERLARRLGRASDRARFKTFPLFCAGVLRLHGSHLGLRPNFRILTLDAERAMILSEALGSRAPWGNQAPPARQIAQNLDHWFRSPPAGEEETQRDEHGNNGWGRWVLSEYVAALIRNNCMDYGSLIHCCIELVRRKRPIREDFPIVYPHVLVDEYQDTNAAQDALLRELWPPGSSEFFAVADDDRTNYRWNGASPERIEALRDDYGMTVCRLPESRRCLPEVVSRANRLMEAGSPGGAGRVALVAAGLDGRPDAVRFETFPHEKAEVEWVARDLGGRGVAAGDSAVLARTGRLVDSAYEALRRAGVPAWSRKPREEFSTPGVRWILAGLRLAGAPRDGAQLRLLVKALHDLTGVSVSPTAVEANAEVENGALLAAFVREPRPLSESALAEDLIRILREQLVEGSDHRRFASTSIDRLRFHERQANAAPDGEAREEIAVWESLTAQIRRQIGADADLADFLHELDLRPIVAGPKPDETQCLTIHQAKGKEFRHVYLLGMAEDQLPSWYARQNGGNGPQMEEERRNCFVAITRASETLTLTYAASYYGREKPPSRFLADLGLLDPAARTEAPAADGDRGSGEGPLPSASP